MRYCSSATRTASTFGPCRSPSPLRLAGAVLGVLLSSGVAAARERIELVAGPPSEIRVTGLGAAALVALTGANRSADDWVELLSVHVGDESRPPLLGSWEVIGEALVFSPRFRLDPAVTYRAVYRRADKKVEADLNLPPSSSAAAPAVIAVHPSAPRLPENLLRFYLHFATAMVQGDSYARIHIEDHAGRTVELAVLEIQEELWDPDGQRLTLLFDPGRIKRDLTPNREQGLALRSGGSYTLVVHGSWRDGSGRTLGGDYRHPFRVGPADRSSPNPDSWSLAVPAAGGRSPLRVEFGEPLDHAQSRRWIWVEDGNGERLAGETSVGTGEQSWSFRPDEPWSGQTYTLRVDARLEDVAGNRVAEPFEVRNRQTAGRGPSVVDRRFIPQR